MDLHAGVLAPLSPATYRHAAHLDTYARQLARVDSIVGRLMDELDRRGLASRTLLAISADHGEELGGHGHYHHNLSLYEPAIRVPLWITGPGVRPGARRETVPLVDLYPTLLAAAGVPPGRSAGRSLWPVLSGQAPARGERRLYSFLPQRGFSRRFRADQAPERGQASLIESATGRKVIVRFGEECWEAYDLADRMEVRNLAGEAPWADTLRARLLETVRRNAGPPPPP
jgi:arylsulfatase A-like enzyme